MSEEKEILLYPSGVIILCDYILKEGLEEGIPNSPETIKSMKELINTMKPLISSSQYIQLVKDGHLK